LNLSICQYNACDVCFPFSILTKQRH
jgi:hypothetical protein